MIFFSPSLGQIDNQLEPLSANGDLFFEGTKVIRYALTDDGSLCVILLDYESEHPNIFLNLLCLDQSDNVIWRLTPPGSPDFFVTMEKTDQNLKAYSFSGYLLFIDIESGNISNSILVK